MGVNTTVEHHAFEQHQSGALIERAVAQQTDRSYSRTLAPNPGDQYTHGQYAHCSDAPRGVQEGRVHSRKPIPSAAGGLLVFVRGTHSASMIATCGDGEHQLSRDDVGIHHPHSSQRRWSLSGGAVSCLTVAADSDRFLFVRLPGVTARCNGYADHVGG